MLPARPEKPQRNLLTLSRRRVCFVLLGQQKPVKGGLSAGVRCGAAQTGSCSRTVTAAQDKTINTLIPTPRMNLFDVHLHENNTDEWGVGGGAMVLSAATHHRGATRRSSVTARRCGPALFSLIYLLVRSTFYLADITNNKHGVHLSSGCL